MKNNASVSECCDEVSLLACSVAAACYLVSLQINILLQLNMLVPLRYLSQLFSQKLLSKTNRSDYALQIANVKTFDVMG